MKKLNVLHVVDVLGWSYDFMDREKSKYSNHNIIIKKHNEINNLDGIDLVWIHSPDISDFTRIEIPNMAKALGIKVIGGYSGEHDRLYSHVDVIATISPQTYKYAKKNYKEPVIYVQESVDTEFFTRKEIERANDYNVGWVGRPSKVKRTEILDSLEFKVLKSQEWGKKFFEKYRSLEPVKAFYNNLDVKILTSCSECCPRVIMEAMSMELPCICTDVGTARILLDDSMVVPIESEKCIASMNAILKVLKYSKFLRKDIGKKNRKRICDLFSWKVNMPIFDSIFEMIFEDRINDAVDLSEKKWVAPYQAIFDKAIAFKNNRVITSNKESINKSVFAEKEELPENNNITKFPIKTILERIKAIENDVILLRSSCFDAIVNGSIKCDSKLFIGINSDKNKDAIVKVAGEFEIPIEISIINCNTKDYTCNGIGIKVPYPVVSYLTKIYGEKVCQLIK